MTSAQRHRDGWKHTEWLLTEQLRQSPAFSPAGPVSLNPKILSFEEGLEKLQPTLPRSGDPTVWTGVSPKHNDSHGAGPCPPGPRWLSIWVCDACLRKQPAAGPGHTTWFLCRPSVGAVPLAGISVLSPSPPSWSYVMLHFPLGKHPPQGRGHRGGSHPPEVHSHVRSWGRGRGPSQLPRSLQFSWLVFRTAHLPQKQPPPATNPPSTCSQDTVLEGKRVTHFGSRVTSNPHVSK